VRFEDGITISTPEGVELELTLAGLGSRFIALLLDSVIKAAVVIALWLLLSLGGGFGVAAYSVFFFLVFFAYDVFFEVLASGRTPGKRWNGLRVVREEGQPIGLLTSAVRNAVRLADFLPAGYAIGCISILVTSKNQRLGDLAAGTLVIRERGGASRPSWAAQLKAPQPATAVPWDVSTITAEEVAAVRQFLDRRFDLAPEARARVASTLAERLRGKVAGVPDDMHVEAFLETLAAAKAGRA
jgi:uncharacterized RDD family membrane protein YckC